MKERPILFSSAMVLALLEGRKTQTRRIIKPPAPYDSGDDAIEILWATDQIKCPYGEKSDRLYVRETWRKAFSETHECFAYKADLKYKCGKETPPDIEQLTALNGGWKPSIHMPKVACRLWLEIVDIRVERLRDISEEDAIAEGARFTDFGNQLPGWHFKDVESSEECLSTARYAFGNLWESIHGTKSWALNPWCWVVEFKKL